MELKECKMGKIVVEDQEKMYLNTTGLPFLRIGHIIGLTVNTSKEVIPVIKWAMQGHYDGYILAIHHANIKLLT